MRSRWLVLGLILLPWAAQSATTASRFDGDWSTRISCPNAQDALGYSIEVPTRVSGGVLHGERERAGQPGYVVIDGKIGGDGKADLYVNGLVGAAPYAVGQRPAGTDYGYHVAAQFQAASASGKRVEGRPCDLKFDRR